MVIALLSRTTIQRCEYMIDLELEEQVLQYLRDHHTMTLATVGPEGPWAAGLFYVNDEFNLYWLSDPRARHSRNIAFDSHVAVTIHEDYWDWRHIQGIQMEGFAEQLGPLAEVGRPKELYLAKYSFLRDSLQLSPALAQAIQTTRVYRFAPMRLYFIDNTKGFGHREELSLQPHLKCLIRR